MNTKTILIALVSTLLLAACSKDEPRRIKLAGQDEGIEIQSKVATIQVAAEAKKRITILFFENQTGDASLNWLERGITEMLITDLSQSRQLDVLRSDRLIDVLKKLGKEAAEIMNFRVASAVAKEAKAEAFIHGRFLWAGEMLRIEMEVRDGFTGRLIQRQISEGPGLENVFTMVDDLTRRIKGDLQISLRETKEVDRRLADVSTQSVEAFQLYAEASDLTSKFFFVPAAIKFREATEIDSTFALAYLRLTLLLYQQGHITEAGSAMEKAVLYSDRVTERERLRIHAFNALFSGNFGLGIDTFRQLTALYPEDDEAHHYYGNLLTNAGMREEAFTEWEAAVTLNPNAKLVYNQLGYAYAYVGRLEDGIKALRRYAELAPDEPNPYDSIGEILQQAGRLADAEKEYKKALKIKPDFTPSLQHLGEKYLDQGRYKKAVKMFEKYLDISETPSDKNRAQVLLAQSFIAMGKKDRAFKVIQKGLEDDLNSTLMQLYSDLEPDSVKVSEFRDRWFEKKTAELATSEKPDLNRIFTLTIGCLSNKYELITLSEYLETLLALAQDPRFKGFRQALLSLIYLHTVNEEGLSNLIREPDQGVQAMADFPPISWEAYWRHFYIGLSRYPENSPVAEALVSGFLSQAKRSGKQHYEIGAAYGQAVMWQKLNRNKEAAKILYAYGTPPNSCWYVVGPFENKGGFNRKFAPENNPHLDASYSGKDGTVSWRIADDGVQDGILDFGSIFGSTAFSVYYALLHIQSPIARDAQIRLGSGDPAKVWLNGDLVHAANIQGATMLDDKVITVNLSAGTNTVLVKTVHRAGGCGCGLYFRLTDPEGIAFDDITFGSMKPVS